MQIHSRCRLERAEKSGGVAGGMGATLQVTNQKLLQLRARISKLQNWLKEEQENTKPPTLADYIQSILSRKA